MEVEVHQTVHGYRRGHELMAASTTLDQADEDLLTQLSDLSGMPVDDKIPDYLTCFPLPSRRYYAVARTWPDYQVRRPGCVLTQTLLVPMQAWKDGMPSELLLSTHRLPNRLESQISSLLLRFEAGDNKLIHYEAPVTEELVTFAELYFCRGKRPVLWLDPHQYGAKSTSFILNFLWPSLRAEFAMCTMHFSCAL